MQKKIVALAVAGLSTAAFAQTNVTIYGVADVSGQGTTISGAKDPATPQTDGSTFNLQSNSSLIGFKGTEDLGNGLKAMFQMETSMYLNGSGTGAQAGTGNVWGTNGMRDSYIGVNSKYGTAMGGYISTPFRQSLNSFDVMPGATGSGQIENMIGEMRFGGSGLAYDSSIRATAVAYAMPTLYGFNGSIAYTGSNNNGTTNQTSAGSSCGTASNGETSACTSTPQSAWGLNLGWTGYGVNVTGAFQQANYNLSGAGANNLGDFTSYLVGATYTGIQNLKLSNVYVRNSLGTNGPSTLTTGGAGKISNNQYWFGASYRMGNWEPAASAGFASDFDGSSVQQYGSKQWTARVGYYLSKRSQVYGLVSNMNNSANQTYKPGLSASAASLTGGQNVFTYGLGMRTSF